MRKQGLSIGFVALAAAAVGLAGCDGGSSGTDNQLTPEEQARLEQAEREAEEAMGVPEPQPTWGGGPVE